MTNLLSNLRKFGAASVLVLAVLLSGRSQAEELIRVDVSGVAMQYRGAFTEAANTWNSLLKGWNPDMPKIFRATLDQVVITASTPFIDGVNGILGQAAPVETKVWNDEAETLNPFEPPSKRWEVAQTGLMQFDIADLPTLAADGDLKDVILHEMAHALGFGSLWIGNEAVLDNNMDGVADEYVGKHGLAGYQQDGGFGSPLIEQQGGGGTAGSHWDDADPILNQVDSTGKKDLMLGFLYVQNAQGDLVKGDIEIFKTTEMSMYDVGFWHSDTGDFSDGAFGGPNKWYGGVFPWSPSFLQGDSTPEPTMAVVFLVGLAGVASQRRRKPAC